MNRQNENSLMYENAPMGDGVRVGKGNNNVQAPRQALRPKLLTQNSKGQLQDEPKGKQFKQDHNQFAVQQPQPHHSKVNVPASKGFQIFCDEEFFEDSDEENNCVVEHKRPESLGDDSLLIIEEQADKASSGSDNVSFSIDHDLDEDKHDQFDSVINFREYSDEVLDYLLGYEKKYVVDAEYMSRQQEVNYKMRNILIDWMVEVTDEYKLHPETLFLAVNIIDRFLSTMSIARQSFQLLGTAALFISSKYEEIYPPEVQEFVFITDESYTKWQVLNMEKLILKSLHFAVSGPTSYYFFQKFLSATTYPECVKSMGLYLVHLAMMEGELFLKYLPSEIATAAIMLSAQTFSLSHLLPSKLFSSITDIRVAYGDDIVVCENRLMTCMEELSRVHKQASECQQQAIYTKFSSERYHTVALVESSN